MNGNGKSQPDIHTARIILDLLVDEALQLGESHDGIEFGINLLLTKAENSGVEVYVVATRKLGIEAYAKL